MSPTRAAIGIIGGSGLYEMDGISNLESVEIDTPFGRPSDAITLGSLDGVPVAFLPRHGRGHRINPTNIPFRANVYALKTLGVRRIISVSAVGSLQEEFAPLDLVVPDQLIDRTRQRDSTFFDEGIIAHVALADPYCAPVSSIVAEQARELGITVHPSGTLVVIEGPAFSTRAESFMYRSWGADIIGMTALPEAKLAREAEMCYATMAWVTDYDCWRTETEAVTTEMVVQNLNKNVAASQKLLRQVVPRLDALGDCPCASALGSAIISSTSNLSDAFKLKMAPLAGNYLDLATKE